MLSKEKKTFMHFGGTYMLYIKKKFHVWHDIYMWIFFYENAYQN